MCKRWILEELIKIICKRWIYDELFIIKRFTRSTFYILLLIVVLRSTFETFFVNNISEIYLRTIIDVYKLDPKTTFLKINHWRSTPNILIIAPKWPGAGYKYGTDTDVFLPHTTPARTLTVLTRSTMICSSKEEKTQVRLKTGLLPDKQRHRSVVFLLKTKKKHCKLPHN